MTLIELLVVMMLSSLLLTIVYHVLITVQRQTAETVRRADSVDQARLGLSQIDRQVRSGNVFYDPVLEALPMSMRVFTQSNGIKTCVQWQVTGGALRTRTWDPATGVVEKDWRTVARNIVNVVDGDPSTPDPQAPFALAGGGTTTSYGKRLVDVVLLVKDDESGGAPVEVRASLSGRNTQYGFDPGACPPPPCCRRARPAPATPPPVPLDRQPRTVVVPQESKDEPATRCRPGRPRLHPPRRHDGHGRRHVPQRAHRDGRDRHQPDDRR